MLNTRPIQALPAVSLVIALLMACQPARAGFISDWEASSGQLPEQISPPYAITSNGNAMHALSNGSLTISTVANSDQFYYTQSGPTIDTSKAFYIEATVRFVSGQTSDVSRAPIDIGFTTAAGVGIDLWIAQGKVFFDTGQLVAGPSVSVDTSAAFHTYRLDYDGNGGVSLEYDGTQILTGHTYASLNDFGSTERIVWGDGSVFASGTSQWQSFVQDALVMPASTVPEPSSCLLVAIGVGACALARRFRKCSGLKSVAR
jgi:PEP-CTERM motif